MTDDSSFDSKFIVSDGRLCIEYFFDVKKRNDKLAFVFTELSNQTLEGNLAGGALLIRNGFDVVCFKSIAADWFQSVPINSFSKIDDVCDNVPYRKRVSYGFSLGGYAAIAFSKHLRCDTVLAWAPQFSIVEPFDTRWLSFARDIQWNYIISNQTVCASSKIFIGYDNKEQDQLHVDRFAKIIKRENLFLLELPHFTHGVGYILHDMGVLKELVVGVLSEQKFLPINFRAAKRRSVVYLYTRSERLLQKGKLKSALSIIEMAIAANPHNTDAYRLKDLIVAQTI